ncbi:MAG: hypothetical protein JWN93_2067 [Hyphomicrobiales bacterium]|nr:hypothetical protein [Hyphomicrobiales bacterium]
MPKQSIALILALGYACAEGLSYVLFLKTFGIAAGLALGLISTMLGIAALKRLGTRFSTLAAPGAFAQVIAGASSSVLMLIGSILLLLPGFVSDFMGLLCLALGALGFSPRLRTRRDASDVIDLPPGEWRRTPD